MKKRIALIVSVLAVVSLIAFLFTLENRIQAQSGDPNIDKLVEAYKTVAASSVADAVDAAVGVHGYMYHDMRPIFNCKMVGRAVTAVMRPSTKAKEQASPIHALQAMDEGAPGSVFVMKVEESLDIAGIGGLMANTCKARGFAGAVIDGAARDLQEIEDMKLPCFSRSITTASSVGRYVSVAKNIPVECAGVTVRPGDIIIGDRDGVVCVPIEKAAEVLELARGYEAKEKLMVPLIHELKSMQKAVEKYKRM